MDRLVKLRHRSSPGIVSLNGSSTSLGAGYETANDDSLTSGCSMYFSMTDDEPGSAEQQAQEKSARVSNGHRSGEDSSIDKTLENDFSVEEVSTIRKPVLAHASPATVKLANKMSVKYLGVSSTPAKLLRSAGKKIAVTPGSEKDNLSGLAKLDETDEAKHSSSMLQKMREPKMSDCSSEDAEESKITLEGSVILAVPGLEGNKSFGTNVLANFFANLDVNKGTPIPEIKVNQPDGKPIEVGQTPPKGRESNPLKTFFESLKKNPDNKPEKENQPQSDRRKSVRKSLIPKAPTNNSKIRSPLVRGSISENRVASPIAKPARKSVLTKMIPDKLKEMRKTNQMELVNFKRKSVIPPPKAVALKPEAVPKSTLPPSRAKPVGDSLRTVSATRKSVIPDAKPSPLKRKSVVPTAIASRRSVLPAKNSRRSVVPPFSSAVSVPPPTKIVPLRVPSKTTVTSSDTSLKSVLGKRASTAATADGSAEPVSKLRKSLAPVKESISSLRRVSPRTVSAPKVISRIRPPSTKPEAAGTGFKKPETLACESCQRVFRFKSSLESHRKIVHQNGSLTQTTKAPGPSKGNKSSESIPTETRCRFCSKSFANEKFLSNHVVSNCDKIPLLEKRKLLAHEEQQRAAAIGRSSPRARPATVPRAKMDSTGSNKSNNRSAEVTPSDTSTSSSVGDTSTASASSLTGAGGGGNGKKRPQAMSASKRAIGHSGIVRTPKREMKCHHCGRGFLNAVEYGLHVQAHSNGGLEPSVDAGGSPKSSEGPSDETTSEKTLQTTNGAPIDIAARLASIRSRMKSSNK